MNSNELMAAAALYLANPVIDPSPLIEFVARHEKEQAEAEVAKAVTADGGLYDLGWYLAWTPGDKDAVLDGKFSAAELRAIADHMDASVALLIEGEAA